MLTFNILFLAVNKAKDISIKDKEIIKLFKKTIKKQQKKHIYINISKYFSQQLSILYYRNIDSFE